MAKRFKKKRANGDDLHAPSVARSSLAQPASSWIGSDWFWRLILFLAIVVAYSPVWWAGYIWDDDVFVTSNPVIVGPLGLKEIWTTRAADICPLTMTTFWFEHALWGVTPLPYHLVNVLMHGACAIVLWQILRELSVPGAWFGAAVWALHPVLVESVAWITELKNTQSCLFYLLAILFFVRVLKESPRSGWDRNYGLTLLFAAMAMASKSSTMILPLVLGLLAWWIEGRLTWRNVLRVTPILLMALAAGVVSLWTESLHGLQWARSWPERLITAGDAIWFYLGKLAWPYPLLTIYPRWKIEAGDWMAYLPLLAVLVVLFFFWSMRRSWGRLWFFVFAYFIVALIPVLGLVEHPFLRYSFVADHFQNLACMGPLVLIAAGMAILADRFLRGQRGLQSIFGAGVLLVLAALSWQQVRAYENEEALWTRTLACNPDAWAGYGELGLALYEKGQVDEAMADYQKALALNPEYIDARNNLGLALAEKGQVDDAIAQYQQILQTNPNFAQAHNNLGLTLVQKGQLNDAAARFKQAFEINPNYAEAHKNLGETLTKMGQTEEGIGEYRKALEISPNYPEAHLAMGIALCQKGQLDEAMAEFQRAVQLEPDFVEALSNLGLIYFQKGNVDEAIVEFRKALALDPDRDTIHFNLGAALSQQAKWNEAIVEFEKATAINPNYAEAHNNLGLALLEIGQVDEAIGHFKNALQLRPDYESARNNLAKAEAFARQGAGQK